MDIVGDIAVSFQKSASPRTPSPERSDQPAHPIARAIMDARSDAQFREEEERQLAVDIARGLEDLQSMKEYLETAKTRMKLHQEHTTQAHRLARMAEQDTMRMMDQVMRSEVQLAWWRGWEAATEAYKENLAARYHQGFVDGLAAAEQEARHEATGKGVGGELAGGGPDAKRARGGGERAE